jgi:threonylcarbamoyladenosine tRNA methylthiotransferase MtaB
VIVGFPTEKEEQFYNTVQLIRICDFSNIHIFPYSSKKGTPASRMPQVNEKIKRERVEILRKQSKEILFKQLNSKIGKSVTILFESNKKSYTDNYYKVKIMKSKQNKIEKSGSVIDVKLVSRRGDLLLAQFKE